MTRDSSVLSQSKCILDLFQQAKMDEIILPLLNLKILSQSDKDPVSVHTSFATLFGLFK